MAERMPKVVVVGGTYTDMAIRCDQIPSCGQTITGAALSYTLTGPGPNQAAEAALCGCQVHLISKIGGDSFAQMVKAALDELNVNTDFVYTAEAKNTGVVVTLVNSEGENTSLIYPGANSALQSREIENAEQIIAQADVCLINGRLPHQAVSKAISLAKLHRTKLILNPARPMDQFATEDNDLPDDYFSADILLANLYEAADITDQNNADIRAEKLIASDLVSRGAGAAVVTMGKRGCLVVDRNSADQIPAFEVDLVDQTCRGDAFAGALAAYCAAADDIRGAANFACAAAALTCTKFGSIEALPTRAEIIELLQKEGSE